MFRLMENFVIDMLPDPNNSLIAFDRLIDTRTFCRTIKYGILYLRKSGNPILKGIEIV